MTLTTPTRDTSSDSEMARLQLKGIDHIELYVGNPVQAAHFYRTAFGFRPVAHSGVQTHTRDRASIVVEQGRIRLALTGPLTASGPVAEHVRLHGDGVKDVAITVTDAAHAFEVALQAGARPLMEPTLLEDDLGQVRKATIAAFGDTVHSFVERQAYQGQFLPGYVPLPNPPPALTTGLVEIDHVAVSMEAGRLDEWVDFYKRVLSFHEMHEDMVSTELSAMKSKAVEDSSGAIKFPIVEPAPARRKSQIEEYLDSYNGPGAQHLAFATDDIVDTVRKLTANGIEFLRTPGLYYDGLEERVGALEAETLAAFRNLGILMDRDKWGSLMQIFTRPVQSRPTMFIEIIQRNGARGFGGANIKALFEAVEREQALRGNA